MKIHSTRRHLLRFCAWCRHRIFLTPVLIACTLIATSVHAATTVVWPEPRLPEEVTSFAIGQAMTVDGLPMRLLGFMSSERPSVVLQAMRRSIGQPLVESASGSKRILGRAEGRFYLTVQIELAPGGSKGILAVVDLGDAAKNHLASERAKAQLLDRMPAGSSIASELRSDDGGKAARHIVILNAHDETRNRDAVVALLASEGFVLEREAAPAGLMHSNLASQIRRATSLYFRAPGKEAMAVITRSGERTAVVLNTVSTLKAD